MEVSESILIEYIKGDLSPDDRLIVEKELERNGDLFKAYIKLKDIWDYAGFKTDALQYNKTVEWNRIENATAAKSKYLSIGLYIRVASIAASIVFAFWLGQFWNKSIEDSRDVSAHVFTAPEGQISELILADGSEIVLNAGSSLTVPSDFGAKNRNVNLVGEGHFDVAKNPELTFSVVSGQQNVTVLGTVFNIRAYPDENKMITTLEEGVVKWESNGRHITLMPDMQVVFDVSNKSIVKRKVDAKRINQWSIGRYVFEDAPLGDVIDIIEKWYDVEVDWQSKSFEGQHFNGVIKKSASLQETMELIEIMTPIKYSIKGQKVSIKRMK